MPTFGNNIKNPYSTKNPHDPEKGNKKEEVVKMADGGVIGNPVEPRRQQTGTGFTNLQKFMGASSGQKLGEQVGGAITSQAQGLQSDINKQSEDYQKGLGQQTSVFDPNARDKTLQDVESGKDISDEQSKQFETYRGGKLADEGFAGGLKGYGDLSSKAQDIEQQGKDVESQSGRYGLLQRYASGGKQYTAGGKRLDAMLMGQGGSQALQQARLATSGLGQQVQKAQTGAQEQYGQAVNQAAQFGKQTQDILAAKEADIYKAVDFPAKQAALKQQYADLQAGLGNRPSDSEAAAAKIATGKDIQAEWDAKHAAAGQALGLSGQYMYGMSQAEMQNMLASVYDPTKMQTASQFADASQNAKMAALAKLSGQDLSQMNWGDTSKAGQASQALNTEAAKAGLASALASKKAALENPINQTADQGVQGNQDWVTQRSQGQQMSGANFSNAAWGQTEKDYNQWKQDVAAGKYDTQEINPFTGEATGNMTRPTDLGVDAYAQFANQQSGGITDPQDVVNQLRQAADDRAHAQSYIDSINADRQAKLAAARGSKF